jgi:hypothetical protein
MNYFVEIITALGQSLYKTVGGNREPWGQFTMREAERSTGEAKQARDKVSSLVD